MYIHITLSNEQIIKKLQSNKHTYNQILHPFVTRAEEALKRWGAHDHD